MRLTAWVDIEYREGVLNYVADCLSWYWIQRRCIELCGWLPELILNTEKECGTMWLTAWVDIEYREGVWNYVADCLSWYWIQRRSVELCGWLPELILNTEKVYWTMWLTAWVDIEYREGVWNYEADCLSWYWIQRRCIELCGWLPELILNTEEVYWTMLPE